MFCYYYYYKLNFKGPYSSSEIEIKFRRFLFTFSAKRQIRHFHVVVVQKQERNDKKVWCTCKAVVLLIKPIVFMTFSLPSASLDLKIPITLFAWPLSEVGDSRRTRKSGWWVNRGIPHVCKQCPTSFQSLVGHAQVGWVKQNGGRRECFFLRWRIFLV